MANVGRRSVLGASLGVAAIGVLARPYVANAAAKTATVWWTQGFIPEEDASFRKMVANYEKVSGNKIDYSIMPFVALGQKMVSALQANNTPDLISYDGIQTTLVLSAWHNKLVDVSDVVATQEKKLSSTALLSTRFYNSVEKHRAYYAVPYKCASEPFHVWANLVEKAGYKVSDVPNKWDERWSWFKPMQAKLRNKGLRDIYALGIQMTTNGPSDGNNVFHGFLIANGGKGIVTPDGKEHTDDPEVREAVIKTIEYFTTAYKEGYVPKGAISWNDADDNNAFHSKLILTDFDGTLSTELAMFSDPQELAQCTTLGLPLGNDGKPIPAMVGVIGGMVPKAAKNVEVAKDFMRYAIEPKVNNEYLKAGLGRFMTVYPEIARADPFWLHNSNPELAPHLTPYVHETILGPTIPDYLAYSPAYAEVEAQQVWGASYSQVYQNGKTPTQAADWAIAQIKAAFAKYPTVTV
jgi:multiple sugar transport system substrate-binding protein